MASARRLQASITGQRPQIQIFAADAILPLPLSRNRVDMAISDLPYGNLAHWGGKQECPGEALLEISSVLKPGSVVALIGPKKTKLEHPIPEKRKDKHRQRSGSYSQPEVSR